MADTTRNASVQITVGVKEQGGSVKSIKTELREAKAEAIEMARKFGETSTQAQDAAKKVAKLRDEVEDLGIRIKGVNPDKFARIASLGQGVAQGFVAAQGAMALFGSESEDLNKTMIKLQGAIAFSQGLQGLKDLQLGFSGIASTIATKVVAAFSTLKGAIISTGLGALAIALGYLVSKLMEAKEATAKAAEEHKNFQKILSQSESFFNTMAKNAEDASIRVQLAMGKITEEQAARLAEERRYNEDLITLQKEIDKAFEEQQKAHAANKARIATNDAATNLKGFEASVALISEFDKSKEEIEKAHQSNLEQIKIKADEKAAAKNKADYDKWVADEAKRKDDELNAIINKAVNEQNARVKIQENEQKEIKDQAEWKKNQAIKDSEEISAILDAEIQSQIDADIKHTEQNKALYQARVQFVKDSLQGISDLVTLFEGQSEASHKRAFEIQKALSIAQTIISTIEAAQAAYKAGQMSPLAALVPGSGNIIGAIQAGIATAAGLARIKQIKSTTFQSSATPSNNSVGGSSYNSPSINPTTNQQRQIVGNTTGATGNQTQTNEIKVYVTETDISSRQGRVDEIRRRALVK